MTMRRIEQKIVLMLYYMVFRKLPYQPLPGYRLGNTLRSWCARKLFKKCGANIVIKSMAYFGTGKNIEIGDYSQLGINCKVEEDLVLGDYVLMGPDVVIFSSSHEYKNPEVPVILQGGGREKAGSNRKRCLDWNQSYYYAWSAYWRPCHYWSKFCCNTRYSRLLRCCW